MEVLVILEWTIVGVVRSAGVSDVDIGPPSYAMKFTAVTIGTYSSRHVRPVSVVLFGNKVAVQIKGFALLVITVFEDVAYSSDACLITITGRAVLALG